MGVGLSIGGGRPLDRTHLARLRLLIDRYAPVLFSEHLAWSTHEAGFLNDLLPLPYTAASLACVVDHLDEVQEALGRSILLENPSTYLAFAESTYSEPQFLTEVVRRAGCGVLLDVNNVYVSSVNHGWNPYSYIDACPLDRVGQIHLAGHCVDPGEESGQLLIDTHRPLRGRRRVATVCPRPAANRQRADADRMGRQSPDWRTLNSQAALAESLMKSHALPRDVAAAGGAESEMPAIPAGLHACVEGKVRSTSRRRVHG